MVFAQVELTWTASKFELNIIYLLFAPWIDNFMWNAAGSCCSILQQNVD